MTTDSPYVRDVADDDEEDGPTPVGLGDRLRDALASSESGSPLYPRLLRLRHIHPNGWQRAALVEGMAIVGGLAALADRATAWAPLILPVAAAAVVKFHDVLAGFLPRRASAAPAGPPAPEDPAA
jgi:hypothetical protein